MKKKWIFQFITTYCWLYDYEVSESINVCCINSMTTSASVRCVPRDTKHPRTRERRWGTFLVGGKTLSLEPSWSLKLLLAQSNFHARRYASFASEQFAVAIDFKVRASESDTLIPLRSEKKKYAIHMQACVTGRIADCDPLKSPKNWNISRSIKAKRKTDKSRSEWWISWCDEIVVIEFIRELKLLTRKLKSISFAEEYFTESFCIFKQTCNY